MSKELHIVFAADQSFFPGLLVCVDSVLIHLAPEHKYTFDLLDGGIAEADYIRLEELVKCRGKSVSLCRHQIDLKKFEGFRVSQKHDTAMAYARLLIPQLLPNIDFVVYLDADILVTRDLSELFHIELGSDELLAAVQDPVIKTLANDCPWELASAEETVLTYVNTGVLLLPIQCWRRQNIAERILELIREDPDRCSYWDQTAINYVAKNRIKVLDEGWNVDARAVAFEGFKLKNRNYHYFSFNKPWLTQNPYPTYIYYALWLSRLDPRLGRTLLKESKLLPCGDLPVHLRAIYKLKYWVYRLMGQERKFREYEGRLMRADKARIYRDEYCSNWRDWTCQINKHLDELGV